MTNQLIKETVILMQCNFKIPSFSIHCHYKRYVYLRFHYPTQCPECENPNEPQCYIARTFLLFLSPP